MWFQNNEQHEIQISLLTQEIKRFQSFDRLLISVARGCSFEALNFMRERSQYIYVKGYVAANQIYRNQPNNVSMNSSVKDCM